MLRPPRFTRAAAFVFLVSLGAACTPATTEPASKSPASGRAGASGEGAGGSASAPSGSSAQAGAGGSAGASAGGAAGAADPDQGGMSSSGGGQAGAPASGPGGATGSTAVDAGAEPAEPDAALTPPAAAEPDTGSYTCTLVIGINATAEWYNQGFETHVDGSKWELMRVHSAFIERWADPNNSFWNTNVSTPCAQNAKTPDRILFVTLNFDYTTLEQWLPPTMATVKNLRERYPSAKRIELGTFVRAPDNKACPQRPAKRSTITPAQDQAIEMAAAANPGVVFVAPKFEALSCNEFSGNPPHPSAAGGRAWARRIAEHYGLGK